MQIVTPKYPEICQSGAVEEKSDSALQIGVVWMSNAIT